VDEDLIKLILVVGFGALIGIFKLLSKFLGPAATIGKVAETVQKSKGWLETLLGDNLDEIKRALSSPEESKPTTPAAPAPKERTVAAGELPRAAESVARRIATSPRSSAPPAAPRLERRTPVVGRPSAAVGRQPKRPPKPEGTRPAEASEEGPQRPLRPVPETPPVAAAGRPVPGPEAVSALALLRSRDPKTLREAIVLNEILGSPKALAGRGRAAIL